MTNDSEQNNYLNDPDVRLMLEVKEGSALAFEELMAKNQNHVQVILMNLLGNWQLAEDLTQEVFFRIYKTREKYTPNAAFSTWLYRIVHNLAFNAIRSRGRHPELLFGSKPRHTLNESSDSCAMENLIPARSAQIPTRQIAQKEIQVIVQQAIQSLNERQRMAILLNRFEGMNYQEIAEVMDLSLDAVKSLLCRARINLKEALTPYVQEGRMM